MAALEEELVGASDEEVGWSGTSGLSGWPESAAADVGPFRPEPEDLPVDEPEGVSGPVNKTDYSVRNVHHLLTAKVNLPACGPIVCLIVFANRVSPRGLNRMFSSRSCN